MVRLQFTVFLGCLRLSQWQMQAVAALSGAKYDPKPKPFFKAGKKPKKKAAKNTHLDLYGLSSGEEVAAWTQRADDCWLRLGC